MNIQGFGALAVIVGVITTLFWMVVAWRAMRAHEKIAEALSTDLARQHRMTRDAAQKEKKRDDLSFREFFEADPLAKHLEPNDQMRRYAEWKQKEVGK